MQRPCLGRVQGPSRGADDLLAGDAVAVAQTPGAVQCLPLTCSLLRVHHNQTRTRFTQSHPDCQPPLSPPPSLPFSLSGMMMKPTPLKTPEKSPGLMSWDPHIHPFSQGLHILGEKSPQTSLVVQWLRPCAPRAEGLGSITGQEIRFHVLQLRPSTVK